MRMYYTRVIHVCVTHVYETHTMCYIHICYAHMSYTCITRVCLYTHVYMYTCVYVCLYIHSLCMCIVYAHIVCLCGSGYQSSPSGEGAVSTNPSPLSPGGVPIPPPPPEELIDVDKQWIYCNIITYIFNLNPIFFNFSYHIN